MLANLRGTLRKASVPGTGRYFSALSAEDKLHLRTLVVQGDSKALANQILSLWKLQQKEGNFSRPTKLEKMVASLYSSSKDAVQDVGDALNVLRCIQASKQNRSYVATLHLLEAYLDHNQLDMAYQCYLDIKRQGHSLDMKALEHFINSAAQHVHLEYIKALLADHLPTFNIMSVIAEPLLMSGSPGFFADQLERYLFRCSVIPHHEDVACLLHDITKARIRRLFSNQVLSNEEAEGMDRICHWLIKFQGVLDGNEHEDEDDDDDDDDEDDDEDEDDEEEEDDEDDEEGSLEMSDEDDEDDDDSLEEADDTYERLIANLGRYKWFDEQNPSADRLAELFLNAIWKRDAPDSWSACGPLSKYLSETRQLPYLRKPHPLPLNQRDSDPEHFDDVITYSAAMRKLIPSRRVNMELEDVTQALGSQRRLGKLRLLYNADLFPMALDREEAFIHAVLTQVFEPMADDDEDDDDEDEDDDLDIAADIEDEEPENDEDQNDKMAIVPELAKGLKATIEEIAREVTEIVKDVEKVSNKEQEKHSVRVERTMQVQDITTALRARKPRVHPEFSMDLFLHNAMGDGFVKDFLDIVRSATGRKATAVDAPVAAVAATTVKPVVLPEVSAAPLKGTAEEVPSPVSPDSKPSRQRRTDSGSSEEPKKEG